MAVGDDTVAMESVLECDQERSALLKREKELVPLLAAEGRCVCVCAVCVCVCVCVHVCVCVCVTYMYMGEVGSVWV